MSLQGGEDEGPHWTGRNPLWYAVTIIVSYAYLGLPRKRSQKNRLGQEIYSGKHDQHGAGKKEDLPQTS